MTLSTSLRTVGRHVLYRTPLHRLSRISGTPAHRSQAYWDEALAGPLSPYLGGTLSIGVRNAVTVELIRATAPHARTLLDIGCAAGTLAPMARGAGIDTYVGVDISEVAIARADRASGEFHVADLCSFRPDERLQFDVIVFNEVLYYTEVDEAVRELERYCAHLAPRGVLVTSLKKDPKSRAILDRARERFDWVNGVLYQEQPGSGRYAVRSDRARPAYLVGVLRPREGSTR